VGLVLINTSRGAKVAYLLIPLPSLPNIAELEKRVIKVTTQKQQRRKPLASIQATNIQKWKGVKVASFQQQIR